MYSLYSAILYSPVTNMNVVLCTTSDTDDDFGHCSFLFVFLNFLFGYIHAAERAVPVSFESALNTAWPTISHQLICTLFSTFYGDAVAIFTKGTAWYGYILVE